MATLACHVCSYAMSREIWPPVAHLVSFRAQIYILISYFRDMYEHIGRSLWTASVIDSKKSTTTVSL